MEEQLARVGLVPARPHDPAEGFETGVGHSLVHGRQRPDFVPDALGRGFTPVVAHAPGELEEDPEIVPGITRRVEGLADALDTALGVRDCALRFGPRGGGRQDDVGEFRGGREEQVLDHHELETADEFPRSLLVSLRLDRVLADDVRGSELAALHGIEHLGQVPALLRRDAHAPRGIELRAQRIPLDVLEPRQPIRQRAHVAAALDVVLSTERAEAAAVAPDVPRQERQRDERQDVVHGVVVLRDPERPAQHRAGSLRVGVGQLADRGGRNARFALRVLERVGLDLVAVGVEIEGGALDELGVGKAGMDDLASHGVGQSDVAADIEAEPRVRPLGRAGPARVHGEQTSSVADPAQQVMEEDRMRLPGIAAPENDQIGFLDLTI